jgi:recombination protein RecR
VKYISESVERAIQEFSRLPGIGHKSAQRHVFFLLKQSEEAVKALAQAVLDLKCKVKYCSICFNITEEDPCPICTSGSRNRFQICIVEEAHDIIAVEKTGEFNGQYHVLGGVLSPLDGIGPDDLRIKELLQRLNTGIKEVIVATNANTEGEATSIYLAKLIKPLDIKLTRIARGIPVGADLEYADQITLSRAFAGRTEL